MKIEKEFVCEELPTRNCHASTVLPLPDGNIVCAWFGGSREGRDDVDIWYAVKDKNGFSQPQKLSADPETAHWNPVLFLRKNGEICLFFKVGKRIAFWRTYISISTDGGRTFSEPEELVKGDRSGGRGPVKNKCLRLKSGRILAPASTEHTGWICFTDISDDDGKTWKKSKRVKTEYCPSIINSGNGFSTNKIPMIQPSLWETEPGTVHMFTRTAAGKIYRSDSTDSGETWCKAYPTDMPNNNSGLDLVKTPDGNLYLVSNPVSENKGKRSPLTLSVSRDGGKSFELVTVLEDEPGKEFSYPAIEYYNGALHITYTWKRHNVVYVKVTL